MNAPQRTPAPAAAAEVVEIVARAMFAHSHPSLPWDRELPEHRNWWLNEAREVITALHRAGLAVVAEKWIADVRSGRAVVVPVVATTALGDGAVRMPRCGCGRFFSMRKKPYGWFRYGEYGTEEGWVCSSCVKTWVPRDGLGRGAEAGYCGIVDAGLAAEECGNHSAGSPPR